MKYFPTDFENLKIKLTFFGKLNDISNPEGHPSQPRNSTKTNSLQSGRPRCGWYYLLYFREPRRAHVYAVGGGTPLIPLGERRVPTRNTPCRTRILQKAPVDKTPTVRTWRNGFSFNFGCCSSTGGRFPFSTWIYSMEDPLV
ncbi:hypothetical protein CEXT_749441 [Caerostris extrusa]|uniref:Uncharacterized protein n=1 Tax=Caerostris extrusa TaxID=172846 RepID=A0AAV4R672_CAEEX|nr:hypothetical protein CEXT_749441 [Caerostris extrusa]